MTENCFVVLFEQFVTLNNQKKNVSLQASKLVEIEALFISLTPGVN
jgi:hypothetical protein